MEKRFFEKDPNRAKERTAGDVMAYLAAYAYKLYDEADAILFEYKKHPKELDGFVTLLAMEATNRLFLLAAETGQSAEELLQRQKGAFISSLCDE